MFELAGHEGWLAPSRFFRRLLDAVSGDTLGVVARVVFAALLLAVVAILARAVWRRRSGPGRTRRGSSSAPRGAGRCCS